MDNAVAASFSAAAGRESRMRLISLLIRPHTLFLWLALIFGAIFVFLTPPFAAPDEPAHFLRTIEIASGAVLSRATLPEGLYDFIRAGINVGFRTKGETPKLKDRLQRLSKQIATEVPKQKVELPYNRNIYYSPAPYLAALPAVWIGNSLGIPIFIQLYLERLLIFLSSTLLIYAAIRITPALKWQFLLLGLFPTTAFIRSSVSADPLTIGYVFLFLALILNTRAASTVTFWRLGILSVLSLCLCLSKSAYIFLSLTFFLLPLHAFPSRRWYFIALIGIVILPVAAGVGWTDALLRLIAAHPFPRTLSGINDVWGDPPWVNEHIQMANLTSHPFRFIDILHRTWLRHWMPLIQQMVGTIGLLDISSDPRLNILLFVMLFAGDPDLQTVAPGWRLRVWTLGLFAAGLISICLLEYISWGAVGARDIEGMQGRYFLPIIPWFLLAINLGLGDREFMLPVWLLTTGAVVFQLTISAYALVHAYYP